MTRRLPMAVIVGGAVAALLAVGGVGAAVALVAGGDGDGDGPSASPIPAVTATPAGGILTPTPTPTPAGGTQAPTPTAGGVATPTATPTPPAAATPTPAPEGGVQLIDVQNILMLVPADWEVLAQEPTDIAVREPETGGLLILTSGGLVAGTTAESLQQTIIGNAEATYPDTRVCGGPEPTVGTGPGLPIQGNFFALCYTVTPQSGSAFEAVDIYYFAVQGSNVFMMNYYARGDVYEAFTEEAYALPAPGWKLYSP